MPLTIFSNSKLLLLLGGLALGVGCSDSSPKLPPTVPISAKVTLNGKPLPKALIAFSPVESGPSSNGHVRDGEVVELWTNGQKQGVIVGDHKVTIYDDDIESGSIDLVPDKYGRIDKGIAVSVTEEGPNEFVFELKK
ncbi:hypothetical protein ACYFX5_06130 [Bremerella sp. T1]|uniref:hypothetical protein n=1 Tax=Bremerella sp. TYQ1 TaxID=3119568 RepID=UPI001CCE21AC|nr:hypothetical protein [Bremerella volcania]UBM37837.1 hypothetical protein LA756_08070 [Bremerella volcania]